MIAWLVTIILYHPVILKYTYISPGDCHVKDGADKQCSIPIHLISQFFLTTRSVYLRSTSVYMQKPRLVRYSWRQKVPILVDEAIVWLTTKTTEHNINPWLRELSERCYIPWILQPSMRPSTTHITLSRLSWQTSLFILLDVALLAQTEIQ